MSPELTAVDPQVLEAKKEKILEKLKSSTDIPTDEPKRVAFAIEIVELGLAKSKSLGALKLYNSESSTAKDLETTANGIIRRAYIAAQRTQSSK